MTENGKAEGQPTLGVVTVAHAATLPLDSEVVQIDLSNPKVTTEREYQHENENEIINCQLALHIQSSSVI